MEYQNILVIEDDEIVARTIERSLRGNEFRITIANSGVEGLKIARRQPTDLVVLDIIMPGMDGYTVCREMRADPLLQIGDKNQ
ncbi:MAG: response regulator [Anaerolineaceae bacterium]|nr:response regulator [Anaerolineaceae bacterium]